MWIIEGPMRREDRSSSGLVQNVAHLKSFWADALQKRHVKSIQTWIDDVQFLITRYTDYNLMLRDQMPAEEKRFDTLAIDTPAITNE